VHIKKIEINQNEVLLNAQRFIYKPLCPIKKNENTAKKEKPTHKLHIWFLPTLKAKTQKTKRAISCLRSTEIIVKNVTLQHK